MKKLIVAMAGLAGLAAAGADGTFMPEAWSDRGAGNRLDFEDATHWTDGQIAQNGKVTLDSSLGVNVPGLMRSLAFAETSGGYTWTGLKVVGDVYLYQKGQYTPIVMDAGEGNAVNTEVQNFKLLAGMVFNSDVNYNGGIEFGGTSGASFTFNKAFNYSGDVNTRKLLNFDTSGTVTFNDAVNTAARIAFKNSGTLFFNKGGDLLGSARIGLSDRATLRLNPEAGVVKARMDAEGVEEIDGPQREGLAAWFDASRRDSLTVNEVGEVTGWRDLSGNGRDASVPEWAANPVLRVAELGAMPMVDFLGWCRSDGEALASMTWATRVENARTVIAVVNRFNGGGWFMGNGGNSEARMFHRANGNNQGKVVTDGMQDEGYGAPGEWRSNGEAVGAGDGLAPHFGVVAFRRAEADATARPVGGFAYDRVGGVAARRGRQMLGEVMVWERALSDAEIRAAEKYLYRKWLAGNMECGWTYLRSGTAKIEVLNGSATLGRTYGKGGIEKTGAGELKLADFRRVNGGIKLKEGTLSFLKVEPWDDGRGGEGGGYPTEGLVAHFDAEAGVETDEAGGVAKWTSREGIEAASASALKPTVYESPKTGRKYMDFGNANEERLLRFPEVAGVKTLVAAVNGERGSAFLLGHETATFMHVGMTMFEMSDGFRGTDVAIAGNDAHKVWMNGERVLGTATPYLGAEQTLTFVNPSGAAVNQFCRDRNQNGRWGGLRLGEALIYNRELTDAERAAAERYLRGKWMETREMRDSVARLDLTGTGMARVKTEGDLTVRKLTGAATLVKAGPGVLRILDASEFTGDVFAEEGSVQLPSGMRRAGTEMTGRRAYHVAEGGTYGFGWMTGEGELVKAGPGTLTLEGNTHGFAGRLDVSGGVVRYEVGRPSATLPALAANGDGSAAEIAHFDANVESRLIYRDGTLVGWTDANNLWPATNWTGVALGRIDYEWTDENGNAKRHKVLDLGTYGWGGCGLVYPDAKSMTGVRSVVMVLGAQNGGGYILGNDTASHWHRGDANNPTASTPLAYGGGWHDAKAWVDGVEKGTGETGALKADYQLLTVVRGKDTTTMGFGCDRPWQFATRRGGQRLGEVILYNRDLTEAERKRVEAYVGAKWFGRIDDDGDLMIADQARSGSLNVSEGARFELGGFTHTTGGVSGGGEVRGGTLRLADGAVVDFAPGATMEVDALAIAGGGTVRLAEGVKLRAGTYPVFRCGELAGAGNLRGWTCEVGRKAKFRDVGGGVVALVALDPGSVILVR